MVCGTPAGNRGASKSFVLLPDKSTAFLPLLAPFPFILLPLYFSFFLSLELSVLMAEWSVGGKSEIVFHNSMAAKLKWSLSFLREK